MRMPPHAQQQQQFIQSSKWKHESHFDPTIVLNISTWWVLHTKQPELFSHTTRPPDVQQSTFQQKPSSALLNWKKHGKFSKKNKNKEQLATAFLWDKQKLIHAENLKKNEVPINGSYLDVIGSSDQRIRISGFINPNDNPPFITIGEIPHWSDHLPWSSLDISVSRFRSGLTTTKPRSPTFLTPMFLGGLDLGSFTPLVIGCDLKGAASIPRKFKCMFFWSERSWNERKQNLVAKWTKGASQFVWNKPNINDK